MSKISAFVKRVVMLPKVAGLFNNSIGFMLSEMGLTGTPDSVDMKCGYHVKTPDRFTIKTLWSIVVEREYGDMPEDGVVIDIGAHIGVFSLYCCMESPKAKIYAFEPFEESYSILSENLAANGLSDRVIATNMAVCGESGERTLYFGKSSTSNSLYENKKKNNEVTIKCTTIHELMDAHNIEQCDLMKIDCEGCEFELFSNVPDEYFERIKRIKMEFHDYIKGYNLEDLMALVMSKGYVQEHIETHALGKQGVVWLKRA